MLCNMKGLLECAIQAEDGALGKVHDFFFEDNSWIIRYVVVDTGT